MRLAVFMLLMSSWLFSRAQEKDAPSPLQIGVGMTANTYFGDLNFQTNAGYRAYPGINFSLQFDRQKPFNLLLNTGFARFLDQNGDFSQLREGEYQPNVFVETSFFYLDFRLKYFFFPRNSIRPFLAAGLGFLSFNPEDIEGNFLIENIFTRLPEEDSYLSLVAQFPLQAGVQLKINPNLSIGLSAVYRFVSSDYLDNISLLGPRPGNDALLAGQAELLFSLGENPDKKVKPRLPEEKISPEAFVVETHDFLMMWEEPKVKKPDQVEPVESSNRR